MALDCKEVGNVACSCSLLATSLRSQGLRLINTCCGRECGAAEGGEMPPVLSETQHCHPVSHNLMSGSLLALSEYSLSWERRK